MPSRKELANAIRALSMDAVQQANSGHPGMPMGMADIAEVLWNDYLSHNPKNPHWDNRDRFVLSNGHGSMLIYSLLHLSGYDLPIEQLRNFRQLHSKTAGHPEYGITPGVETTTGPLGQGIANAVGMALAEKTLAARFNQPGYPLVDHYTYVFTGDGCLMEGVSHEACSLAGTLGLGKLILMYDDNGISIDGEVQGWFTDDTPKRFESYGWHVIDEVDGHDADAINRAIEVARAVADKPSLICCQTVIGYGAPSKQGTEATHGAPLGDEEIAATRKQLGWSHAPFDVPSDVAEGWDASVGGAEREASWNALLAEYREKFPDLAQEYCRRMAGDLPEGWQQGVDGWIAQADEQGSSQATRKASLGALNAYGPMLPELIGGSADLAGSNNTFWKGSVGISAGEADGNYIYYGVREFGMTAMNNGLALHGGFIPYGATFLTFSDYARNAVRMAALMKIPNIIVYTHDSIGLGEDGPTHQPVEHLASLRLMPGLDVWRPCDTVESAVAWRCAIERRDGPSVLVFSRQGLPHQPRDTATLANIQRGGYVLSDTDQAPQAIIIATGSEVSIAVSAAEQLRARGHHVRVVSMPATGVFEAQDEAYREAVLPSSVRARLVIEAGATAGWRAYTGFEGRVLGLDSYGESAPAKHIYEHFKITDQQAVRLVEDMLKAN